MDNFDIERECELEHERQHYEDLTLRITQEEIRHNESIGTVLFVSGLAIIIATILVSVIGFYNAEAFLSAWQYIVLCGIGIILMVIGGNQ